ncbi:phage tail protein [Streptococcus suis]|uniref:phage tail spike protein n=1 Tax=Streptococcus suis TaxID=1307 RepID=UPI0019347BC8|nr:phage tail spike protein [Streptococcus suis]MBM0241168.1 phage tail protein [Streptococcus suis]MBM7153932.1 phage tail protein [Streptococcus suis]MBM7281350.1 phage tail protein [Streptococcus suis]MBO4134852.1 phage tail protein [Streptococcus suis]MDG4503731.1 gp58-like family protein [Streptococcus suis]
MISVFPSTAYTKSELAGVGYPILNLWCESAKLYIRQNGHQYIKLVIPHRAKGIDVSLLPKELQIIKIHDIDGKEDYYRVRKPQHNLKYTTIYAEHITYDLNDNLIEDIFIVNSDGQQALDKISKSTQYPHPFDLRSDIDSVRNLRLVRVNPMQAILGTEDNTFVNRFGGEVKRQGFTISVNKRVGVDRTDVIRSGKNLTGFEANYDFNDVATRIMPKGPNGILLPEKYVDSPLINHYPIPFIRVIDYKVEYEGNFDDLPQTEKNRVYNELRELAKADFKKGVDVPSATYKVNFVSLRNTIEYRDYEALENIGIGDLQPVYEARYDIEIKGRVTDVVWDLLNKNYESITLGNFRDGIVQSTITSQRTAEKRATEAQETANLALRSADGKATNYYGNDEPSNPSEGDLWYKKNGQEDEIWQYQLVDGKLQWVYVTGTLYINELKDRVSKDFEKLNTEIKKQEEAQARQIADVLAKATSTKEIAEQTVTDLMRVRNAFNQSIGQANTKALELERSIGTIRTDVMSQAQTILAQAQAQTALTNRVTTVETLADGTRSTVAELSKTVSKATGDIASVSSRTKTVEDTLSQTRTQYEALSQTVNAQTGQIDSINRKTADLQSGIDGVTERFENLQVGGENLLLNAGFEDAKDRSETFAVGGVVYTNKLMPKWGSLYNSGISNPTTAYHAIYRESFNGKGPVIEFNESNGQRNWKGINAILRAEDFVAGNYMFSADVYATGPGTKIWFGFYYYNKRGSRSFHDGQTTVNITTTNSWHRVAGQIKLSDDIDTTKLMYLYIYAYNFESNSILYLTKPKLEEGTVATAFSLAQETIRSEIASYKRTAEESSAELSRQIQTVDGKAVDAKNYAQQTAEGFKTRIESLETYKNAEGTRASQYFTASRDETARQVTALRTAVTDGYVAKAKYEEDARGVTQRFESLQVGGRNYIRNFGFTDSSYTLNNNNSQWRYERIADPTSRSGYHIKATCTQAGSGGFHRPFVDLRGAHWQGRTMTYAVDVKCSRAVTIGIGAEAIESGIKNQSVSTEWQRFAVTGKVKHISTWSFVFYIRNTQWQVGDVVYIRDPQLEDGTMATTPSPAPEDQQSYADTKISEYQNTVDGRFATLQSQKANQVDFQAVKETAQLYERIIGSTEIGIKDKVARMVMADSLFLTEVKDKISGTATQVSQLNNSYAIKNLTSAGTVLNQINLLANGTNRIDGRLTHITGQTLIDNGVIKTAMIGNLDAGKITTGYLASTRIATNSIDGSKLVFDQAFVNKMTANKALFKQLFAQSAFITSVQAVTLSASQITGGLMRATNGAMEVNLNSGQILHYTDQAALKRILDGYPTQFVKFATGTVAGKGTAGVTVIGSNRRDSESSNDGGFVGIRAWNGSNIDQIDVVGDTVRLASSTFESADGWTVNTLPGKLDIDAFNADHRASSKIKVGDLWLWKNATTYSSMRDTINLIIDNLQLLHSNKSTERAYSYTLPAKV